SSHPHPDIVSVGQGRLHPVRELRPRLRGGDPRRAVRADRQGRPLPAHRAAAALCRPRARVRGQLIHPEDMPMPVYHFTEQAYPPAWDNNPGTLRVTLPNRRMDPKIAGDLFHRYYDEWQLADDLGIDVMLNEHHQTATCMSSTCIVGLSILARI